MKTTKCMPQKLSKLALGSFMLAAAVALIVISITLLPVFGLVLALPVIALSFYIFNLRLNDQCEIDLS